MSSRLSGWAAGVLVAIVFSTWGVFAFRTFQNLYSPPDQPREWGEKEWEDVFDLSVPDPLPTLLSEPAPALTLREDEYEFRVESEYRQIESNHRYYEVFDAGDGGREIVLPTGNRLILEAIALVLPSDGEWENERYPKVVADWRDPMTLEPASSDMAGFKWKELMVRGEGPRLYIRVSHQGERPLRWHAPRLYDERMKLPLNQSRSISGDETHAEFYLDLDKWHQSPVRLVVEFAFGEADFRELPLEEEASVEFDGISQVRILNQMPQGYGVRSYSSSSFRQTSVFRMPDNPSDRKSAVVLFVWPPNEMNLIDFQTDLSPKRKTVWGVSGTACLDLYLEEKDVSRFQVRRLPRLGRAVFHLPALPRLVDSENLFETPIDFVRIGSEHRFSRVIANATGLRWTTNDRIPRGEFPMNFKDTTPIALLEEFEKLSGGPQYFDRYEMTLSSKKPPNILERLLEWWRQSGFKPDWLP